MLPRVLPVSRGDKERYLDAARTRLLFGVASHRRTGSASSRSPVERFGQISPRRHIFIHNGAPQALFDCHENHLVGSGRSSSGGLLELEGDCIAEPFQPALEVGCGTGLVELVEIRFAQITVC